ncbi:MAG: hypothetical protein ACI8Q1_003755, partial [Parvicella sp.]
MRLYQWVLQQAKERLYIFFVITEGIDLDKQLAYCIEKCNE